MALKKSDLYSSLWKSCDELRGGMDASQYKDYILTLLFVKYVSDKAKADPNSLIDVPAGGSFDDMVALKGDKEIGDRINKIIGKLAEANDLQKVIDLADFNDEEKLGKGKEMQDRLSKLVTIFDDLDFRGSPRRGRRPARRRLRVPDAALRHRVRQEQGPVLHAGRGLADPGQGRRHRTATPARTRPSTTRPAAPARCCSRLPPRRRAASRSTARRRTTPPGRCRKMNMILHGNEIADIRKGDTITSPQFTRRRPAQDLRLRRHEPAVLGQVLEQRPGERVRPLRVRPAAGEERRLRLPAARPQVAQEHRQGGGHPAARRPVPRQRRGHDPQGSCSSAASSRASSACRQTSSTAPASRPASSSSTRRTPSAAPASS